MYARQSLKGRLWWVVVGGGCCRSIIIIIFFFFRRLLVSPLSFSVYQVPRYGTVQVPYLYRIIRLFIIIITSIF
jgi:hypothetical protein